MRTLTAEQRGFTTRLQDRRKTELQVDLRRINALKDIYLQDAREVLNPGDVVFADLLVDLDNVAPPRALRDLRQVHRARQRLDIAPDFSAPNPDGNSVPAFAGTTA